GLLIVGFAVLPGPSGVQQFARDPGHLDGDVQAEEQVLPGLGVVELAPYHGAHHLAGGGDVYAAPYAVRTAGPTGVYEVAAGTVRAQPLGEHLGVGGRRQGEERGAEAGGEGRFDVGLHVGLGTGELGGVAREEVVGGLRGREGAYGGQDPEGVGRQEQNGRGVAARAVRHGSRYVLQRVGDAGVLRQHAVGVIHLARATVHHHVLQHRPEADGIPDLGFLLRGQVYRLGVAATLEVEDPGVGPAVLVVPDQAPIRIRRQRGLARAREPEKEGHVPLLFHVGR